MTEAQNPLTPSRFRLAEEFTTNLARPDRALAVGAHPDDIEFGAGGTLAKWAASGSKIQYVVVTDGSKGSWESATDKQTLIETREEEQRLSAEVVGADSVIFLGHVDGELDPTTRAIEELVLAIRKFEPNIVLGHDPWKPYRLHPDHRHAGQMTCDAVVSARDPLFFPNQNVDHHRPEKILLWEAGWPDHVEDVGDFVDAKFDALSCHRSQFTTTMESPGGESFRAQLESKLEEVGRATGVEHGEAFKMIDDL